MKISVEALEKKFETDLEAGDSISIGEDIKFTIGWEGCYLRYHILSGIFLGKYGVCKIDSFEPVGINPYELQSPGSFQVFTPGHVLVNITHVDDKGLFGPSWRLSPLEVEFAIIGTDDFVIYNKQWDYTQ